MKKINLIIVIMVLISLTGCASYVENIQVTTPTDNGVSFERRPAQQYETSAAESSVTSAANSSGLAANSATPQTTFVSGDAMTTADVPQSAADVAVTSADSAATTAQSETESTPKATTLSPAPTTSISANMAPTDSEVVDLTLLSQTMVYSALNDMMVSPANYAGKIVKISGITLSDYDENANQHYYYIVVYDAAACCQQGLEYRLAGNDYPPDDIEVTVKGVFEPYEYQTGGQVFYRLNQATIAR